VESIARWNAASGAFEVFGPGSGEAVGLSSAVLAPAGRNVEGLNIALDLSAHLNEILKLMSKSQAESQH
jgi:hypothetical protein